MEIDNEHGMEAIQSLLPTCSRMQKLLFAAQSVCLMPKLLLATLSTQSEACNSAGDCDCGLRTGNRELGTAANKQQMAATTATTT